MPSPPSTCLGALTKTIVATKERLEGDVPRTELPSHHPGISEVQRRKEKEMVAREVCVCGVYVVCVCGVYVVCVCVSVCMCVHACVCACMCVCACVHMLRV